MIKEIVAEKAMETIFSNIEKIYSELKEEYTYLTREKIISYLENSLSRMLEVKTILHGSNPRNFYDVYFPLDVVINKQIIKTNSIEDVFFNRNSLVIMADAGSGKSMLFKHLFINTIQNGFAIPIMIELRYFNESNGDFNSYIQNAIKGTSVSENQRIIDRLCDNGSFAFFFDGFDEVRKDYKPKVVYGIKTLTEKFCKCKYLISTRPYTNIEMLPNFITLKIKPLDANTERVAFIRKQLLADQETATRIINSIDLVKKNIISSFLSNPLLLSLYILTYQSYSEIPTQKSIFYKRVIDALLDKHDCVTKTGFTRERESKITIDVFNDLMKRFSMRSFFENKITFDYDYARTNFRKILDDGSDYEVNIDGLINDLKLSFSLWIDDDGTLSFAHRSLQEYFAALFVKDLPEELKKKTYQKIIDRLKSSSLGEMHNFFSILQEIDYIYFANMYWIPALEELVNKVFIMNNSEITSFLLVAITFDKSNEESISPSKEFSYYSYVLDQKGLWGIFFSKISQVYISTYKEHIDVDEKFNNGSTSIRINLRNLPQEQIKKIDEDINIKNTYQEFRATLSDELRTSKIQYETEHNKLIQIIDFL
jgi:hypothetical protein